MVNQRLREAWDTYIEKAKSKKMRKETAKVLGMLALSKKAVEHFGNSLVSFEHLITLIDKYDEKEAFKLYVEEINKLRK